MKYKLLKDTPTIKAGTIFEEVTSDFDELKELVRITPIGAKTCPQFTIQDIDNFDEWFEKIEPKDSIHWKPLPGDIYWYLSNMGVVLKKKWMSSHDDIMRHVIGNIYCTEKECEKARDRELAEVRLRRTSTFKPDFENDRGGYVVFYNPEEEKLETHNVYCYDYGEIVHYETVEEAEKSIKENERDWKIYFGIKEEE